MTFTPVLSPLEVKLYKPYCVQRVVKRTEFTRLFALVLENTPYFFVVYQQTRSILFRMGY